MKKKKKKKRAAPLRILATARALGYPTVCAMFDDLYVRCGLSTRAVGRQIGRSDFVVRRHLRLCGIPVRARGGPNGKKIG